MIYPAYAALGEHFGANTEGFADEGDLSGGLGGLHDGGHDHAGHAHAGHSHRGPGGDGFGGQEQMELSMENLKAELEQLGLSLDDDEDADGSAEDSDGIIDAEIVDEDDK